MPETTSPNPTFRISRIKVLVAAAVAALTLSLGLQAANPAPASARMSVETCKNLSDIAYGLAGEGFSDAAQEIRLLMLSEGCWR